MPLKNKRYSKRFCDKELCCVGIAITCLLHFNQLKSKFKVCSENVVNVSMVYVINLFRSQNFFIVSFEGNRSEVQDRYPSKDVISVSIKSSFVSVLTKYACYLNMTYYRHFASPYINYIYFIIIYNLLNMKLQSKWIL